MCGLVGCAGNLFFKDIKTFNDMLVANAVRGALSTGVASFTLAGDGQISKVVGNPHDLMDQRYYDRVVSTNKYVVIGHGRSPTRGSVSKCNAHPFSFDGVTGAHNGTLVNYHRLDDASKFDTDSEALFNTINNKGIEATIPMLEGAWALSFFDHNDKSINLIKNDQRPLFYAFSEDHVQLFWASESGMLKWAAHRNDVKLHKVLQLVDDVLYTFPAKKLLTDAFAEPQRRRLERYKAPPSYVGGNREYLHGGYGGTRHLALAHVHSEPTVGDQQRAFHTSENDRLRREAARRRLIAGGTNVIPIWEKAKFRPPYIDEQGVVLTKPAFMTKVAVGCCWCEDVPVWGDRVYFMGKDDTGCEKLLCDTCLMDEQRREIMGL